MIHWGQKFEEHDVGLSVHTFVCERVSLSEGAKESQLFWVLMQDSEGL